MAKIKLVAPYEEFRGRDSAKYTPNGSVVFPRAGALVSRSFARPKQPNSQIQYSARFLLTLAAKGWGSLGDPDKDLWTALGLTITRTTTTGFTFNPTGRALYVESSIISSRNQVAQPASAPPSVVFPSFLAATNLIRDPLEGDLQIEIPDLLETVSILVFLCGPLPAGVRSLRGRNFFNPTLTPFDPLFISGALGTYVAGPTEILFPTGSLRIIPKVGERWGVRLVSIDPLANIAGPVYESLLTVEAP